MYVANVFLLRLLSISLLSAYPHYTLSETPQARVGKSAQRPSEFHSGCQSGPDAYCAGADLETAKLEGAIHAHADLQRVNFKDAKLTAANMDGANMGEPSSV